MIIELNPTTNFKVECLEDLSTLSTLYEVNHLKPNLCRLSRELNHDRRTIKKYLDGYNKPTVKTKSSKIDAFYEKITELLSDDNIQIFEYKQNLWQFLKDNHGLNCAESSFRRYISKYPELDAYFKKSKNKINSQSIMRFETEPGEQAQLDWKESMNFTLSTGEVIEVNIFVLILSYSRFRIFKLSLTKSQEILLNFLTESFEAIEGVPKVLITDNMKTVMDSPRTEYTKGKVNDRFANFAKDFGFTLKPCIAGRPNTKGKVETTMKLLDEIKAYNGLLSYQELHELVVKINDRVNASYHQGSGSIPAFAFKKEKDHLSELPNIKIRGHYKMINTNHKVNKSSLFSFRSNMYSVPPEYIGKTVRVQVYANQLHVYYSTKLIAVHPLTNQKLNYQETDYLQITRRTFKFADDRIRDIAKENLRKIGDHYKK
jgi:hypothetical protein